MSFCHAFVFHCFFFSLFSHYKHHDINKTWKKNHSEYLAHHVRDEVTERCTADNTLFNYLYVTEKQTQAFIKAQKSLKRLNTLNPCHLNPIIYQFYSESAFFPWLKWHYQGLQEQIKYDANICTLILYYLSAVQRCSGLSKNRGGRLNDHE